MCKSVNSIEKVNVDGIGVVSHASAMRICSVLGLDVSAYSGASEHIIQTASGARKGYAYLLESDDSEPQMIELTKRMLESIQGAEIDAIKGASFLSALKFNTTASCINEVMDKVRMIDASGYPVDTLTLCIDGNRINADTINSVFQDLSDVRGLIAQFIGLKSFLRVNTYTTRSIDGCSQMWVDFISYQSASKPSIPETVEGNYTDFSDYFPF